MRDFTDTETIYRKQLRTVTLRINRLHIADSDKKNLTTVTNPDDVHEILKGIFATLDDDQEHMVLLVLNVANEVTGFKLISSGGQNSSLVDPKIIFRNALLLGARQIIIAHNHPSGNMTPSGADLQITRKIAEGGETLDLPLLDHIIVTENGFTSIRRLYPDLFGASF